jgi:hypothetical protein
MTQWRLSPEEVVEQIYIDGAQLLQSGLSESQVAARLVERGLDQKSASMVVDKLLAARAQAFKEAAKKNMVNGALILIAGLFITFVSFASVSQHGGTCLIWTGALGVGGALLLRGFYLYRKGRQLMRRPMGVPHDEPSTA